MATQQYRRRKRRLMPLMLIVGVLVMSALSFVCLYYANASTLIGRWESEQTGEVIRFKKNGEVVLKDSTLTGSYHIISPNTMEYAIDGITFNMIYHIENDDLYWGITESELEHFVRK